MLKKDFEIGSLYRPKDFLCIHTFNKQNCFTSARDIENYNVFLILKLNVQFFEPAMSTYSYNCHLIFYNNKIFCFMSDLVCCENDFIKIA